jgi:polysaccharide biosynthesis transport protein
MEEQKRRSSAFELVRSVWNRRKWVALAAFAIPFTGAVTLATSLPNIYQSTAMVIVQHKTEGAEGDTRELETRLHTLSQENLSRSRLQELIEKHDLYPELRAKGGLENAIGRMRKDVQLDLQDVEQVWGKATVAMNVSYRGRDPEVTAQVTNALAAYYVDENQAQRKKAMDANIAALELQLDQMSKRMGEEEGRIRGFKERHLKELPQQVEVNLAAIERLMTELQINRDKAARRR